MTNNAGRGSGRINYELESYCRNCVMKIPKVFLKCPTCHNTVRRKPHYRRSEGKVYY